MANVLIAVTTYYLPVILVSLSYEVKHEPFGSVVLKWQSNQQKGWDISISIMIGR